MTLDFVTSWTGGCYWGSKKVYPDIPSFLAAVKRETSYEPRDLVESEVTETRLRHCVGGDCGEDAEPHWHPTENIRGGAPVWQYGREY